MFDTSKYRDLKSFLISKLFSMAGYVASQMFAIVIPIVITFVLACSFSLADFGLFSLFRVFWGFAVPVIGFNLSTYLLKSYFHGVKEDLQAHLTLMVIWPLLFLGISLAVLFLMSDVIKVVFKINDLCVPVLALISAYLYSVSGLGFSLFRAEGRSWLFFVASTISPSVVIFGILILHLSKSINLFNVLFLYALSYLLAGLYALIKLHFNFSHSVNWSTIRRIAVFSFPLVLYSLLAQTFAMSDRFFLNYFLGKEALAVYSASFQLAYGITAVGVVIQLAWTPYVFKTIAVENGAREVYKNILLLAIFLFVFSIAYALLCPLLLLVFLPEKYKDGLSFFPWFIIGGYFQCIYWLLNPVLIFYEKNYYFVFVTIISAVISMSLNYSLVHFGMFFVAVNYSISWLVQLTGIITAIYYVRKNKFISV